MTRHPHLDRLDRLDRLAHRLDSAFRIPGTRIRLGYDSLLGLVPGIGDVASVAPAAYIVLESQRMGVPTSLLVRQAANIGIDALVGSVPLVGDLFDVGYKANRRNVALLRRHLEGRHGASEGPRVDPQPGPERDLRHRPGDEARIVGGGGPD